MNLSWTQSVCQPCWDDEHSFRRPVRITDADEETCCYCGTRHRSGIYVRVDPRTVPHPSPETAA